MWESDVRSGSSVIRSADRIGRRWATMLTERLGRSVDGLSPVEVGLLAEAEHESWIAHHEEHGWRYSPDRRDARRRHDTLLPWQQLPEHHRAKDLASVESAFVLLETLGFTMQTKPTSDTVTTAQEQAPERVEDRVP